MTKHLISISILLLSMATWCISWGQNSNIIECVEVLPDGSVTISWTPYDNSNTDFLFYQVNRRLPGSPVFNNLSGGLTNANLTSFTDSSAGLDANNNEYCYEVIVNTSGTSGAIIYPTMCTLLIDVQESFTLGYLDFTWNDPAPDPSAIPNGSFYSIMYENPPGTWNVGASFPYSPSLEFYQYEILTCNDLVNYQLTLESSGASCASVSNAETMLVENVETPDTPILSSVSVDSISGNAIIDWFSVSSPDLAGYVILGCDPIFDEVYLDTIFDPSATQLIFQNSDAANMPESYLVYAFDNCITAVNPLGNEGTSQDEGCNYYQTMHLSLDWATCQDFIDLEWTPYTGWGEDNVAYYEVYRRTNGGPDEFLSIIDAEEDTYRDFDIDVFNDYSYYVKAYSGDIAFFATSISNIAVLEVTAPPLPTVLSLASASVNINQEVEITMNRSATSTEFDFALQRKKESDPFFRDLITETPDNTTADPYVFTDSDVETDVFSYLYRVALINACNDTVAFSNLGKTILLQGIYNEEELINTISWTDYGIWENGVESYDIYRSVDGAPYAYLTNTSGNIRFIEDDVSAELESEGNFCYRVEANELANPLGINAESNSNNFCLSQPPKIFIPNAFAINGINDEYGPRASFVDRDSYQMIIYNRWGQEIWKTTDLETGWDGRINGSLVQEGNYMYYVGIRNGEGQLFEFRGPLTILIFDAN